VEFVVCPSLCTWTHDCCLLLPTCLVIFACFCFEGLAGEEAAIREGTLLASC
jgi:hypothetical protein